MPIPPNIKNPSLALLLTFAQRSLSMTQKELGDALVVSKRTIQRWQSGRTRPYTGEIHRLVDLLAPVDADLSTRLDAWAPRPKPPPPAPPPAPPPPPPPPPLPPPPPPPPPIPPLVLVESVVCAAADAMGLVPQAIRPAVLAAFTRARDARLDAGTVVDVLAPPSPAGPPKGATAPARAATTAPAPAATRHGAAAKKGEITSG